MSMTITDMTAWWEYTHRTDDLRDTSRPVLYLSPVRLSLSRRTGRAAYPAGQDPTVLTFSYAIEAFFCKLSFSCFDI